MIPLRLALFALVAASAAACHGSAAPASPQPPAGPTCTQVADAVMASMPQGAGELATKLHAVVVRRCDQDQWTADAKQCVIDAKTHEAAAACESKLTDAQKEALDKDGDATIDELRSSAPGGGAGGAGAGNPDDSESDGAGAPAEPATGAAPPPPVAPAKGASKPKRDSDPCAGGQ